VDFLLQPTDADVHVVEFLRRLLATHQRPLLVVTPPHRYVYRAVVTRWLAAQQGRIVLEPLVPRLVGLRR
jgi:hypothetical protein